MLPQHRHGMSTLLTRHTQHASTKLRTLIPVASVAQPSSTSTSQTSKAALLEAVSLADRGLLTDSAVRKCIDDAISSLEASSNGRCTTSNELSATWKLLYTTEKETLFILEKAGAFGTKAGDVFQVIDLKSNMLQNVITFPPEGAFIVDSSINVAGLQRVDFQFNAAGLKLPEGRRLPFPPFGQGWFDTVYLDEDLRISKDSRGDTLVTARAGPPRVFK